LLRIVDNNKPVAISGLIIPSGKGYVWVLHPKLLAGFVRHEPKQMTREQIHVVVEGLKRHQKSMERAVA
jgi:hypothetical protein